MDTALNEPLILADVRDCLVATNELGDGTFDFRIDGDGLVLLDVYTTDTMVDGRRVPEATYKVNVGLELIPAG